MLDGIGVVLGLVLADLLSHLLLLELPDVQLLVSILKDIDALWDGKSFFEWST